MPVRQMQAGTAFQLFHRGNISSVVATKWLVFFIPVLAGTIIFDILNLITGNMSKFLTYIKTLFVAMINVCLLCGAGYVLDWFGFAFNKTSKAGRRIKRFILKTFMKLIPAPIKRT
jgi:hypothetical protein